MRDLFFRMKHGQLWNHICLISSILHILKTGGCWCDVPLEYGPAKTIYNRYRRWAGRGVWQRIFANMATAGEVLDELMLDSSIVKAHRSAVGGKGGSGRRRSGCRVVGAQPKSIVWPMIGAGYEPLP